MLNGCAYILTVDVGNTFIRFGLFAEDSAAAQECPLATCEITTPSSITADEARMRLAQVMGALAADAGMPGALVPAAAVLSCVVPALERPWKVALSRTCTGRVLTVGPGLKTGMPVHYDDPAEIGPDRIADAVAARAVYGSPCIVIDLGTTTNIEVSDTPEFATLAASIPVEAGKTMTNVTAPFRMADGVKALYFRFRGEGAMNFFAFELS